MIWSYFRGPKADPNPWGAASLEWQTPDTPPKHGNWGDKLPVVYRWAYDYSVPGAARDFIAAERAARRGPQGTTRHEPVQPPDREELGDAGRRTPSTRHCTARPRRASG